MGNYHITLIDIHQIIQNIEILLSSFLIRNPKLDLSIIVKLLDTPEFEIRDYQGVSIISAAFNLLSKNVRIESITSSSFIIIESDRISGSNPIRKVD